MPCRRGHVLNYDRRCRFCGISLEFEAAAIFKRENEEEDERSGESPPEDEGSSAD